MLLEALLGSLLIVTLSSSTAYPDYTCSPLDSFPQVAKNTFLDGSQFYNFSCSGLLACVKECQLYKRCLSFNFDTISGLCVLNERTANGSEQSDLLSDHNVVHSDIEDWSVGLAGSCAHHSCLDTSVCRPSSTGDTYYCETVYCANPPSVLRGRMLGDPKTFWELNETISYECEVGSGPVGQRVCSSNGSWSYFNCLRLASCKNIKTCNRNYGDGEYWVQPNEANGTFIKVYCHGMNTTSAGTFMTLEGENYSFFLDHDNQKCLPHWSSTHHGTTTFRKVKFNVWDFGIQHGDHTFAETDGMFTSLGRTGDCRAKPTCNATETGSFRIDTTGTGVKMSTNLEWTNNTIVTRLNNGLVIIGECFADCTKCKPTAPYFNGAMFNVVVDQDFTPNYTEATFPECVP